MVMSIAMVYYCWRCLQEKDQQTVNLVTISTLKKLGRVGKDRPTGIDFLEEASASPTEKIPEPWPRPDTGRRNPWELPAWAM